MKFNSSRPSNEIPLDRWYQTKFIYPFGAIILVLFFAIAVTLFYYNFLNKQEIQRFADDISETFAFAIQQRNRVLIENTASLAIRSRQIDLICIYEGQSIIYVLPSKLRQQCKNNNSSFFKEVYAVQLEQSPNFRINFYFRSFHFPFHLFLYLGIFLVCLGTIIRLIFIIRKGLHQNLIGPLNQNISQILSLRDKDIRFKYSTIKEINDLFAVFLSKINELHELSERELESTRINTKNQAIAQTTQMLAHDVRKPFSMLQALIQIIKESNSFEESKEALLECIPSISAAINSVNGMIADVMEIGTEPKMNCESVEIIQLIKTNLSEIFSYNESAKIKLIYSLAHNHRLKVDVLKVNRVFANIIGNAVEHMQGKGIIWINSKEVDNMLQLCIGNSDSFIAPEDLSNLFEAFFTKNKKGGTGLGLAIAKKIVEAHGGKIWCESKKEKGTEFFFTLPKSHELTNLESNGLPTHSSEFLQKMVISSSARQNANQIDEVSERQIALESEIFARKGFLVNPIKIALVDDESIYIKSLETHIKTIKSLSDTVNIFSFSNSESLIRDIKQGQEFDLVILDVDYGVGRISGFEATEQMRTLGFKGKVCIHSNRGTLEFQPKALKAGAELFLPKPMTKEHLLSLILSLLSDGSTSNFIRGKIILFEDEKIYQRRWKRMIEKENLLIYTSLSDFAGSFGNTCLWSDIDFIVTDFYLENNESGFDVYHKLRELGCRTPIFLSSNLEFSMVDGMECFSAIVAKDPERALEQIFRHLERNFK